MKKQQSGFTLIELIMVIVVLGILAAFALPKFANLSGDARAATLQGAFASVKATSAMVHSSFLAKNDSTVAKVSLEGGAYAAVVNGYPAAKDGATPSTDGVGVAEAAGISSSDFQIDVATAGTVNIRPNGVSSTSATCVLTYTQASSGGVPEINIKASNCN